MNKKLFLITLLIYLRQSLINAYLNECKNTVISELKLKEFNLDNENKEIKSNNSSVSSSNNKESKIQEESFRMNVYMIYLIKNSCVKYNIEESVNKKLNYNFGSSEEIQSKYNIPIFFNHLKDSDQNNYDKEINVLKPKDFTSVKVDVLNSLSLDLCEGKTKIYNEEDNDKEDNKNQFVHEKCNYKGMCKLSFMSSYCKCVKGFMGNSCNTTIKSFINEISKIKSEFAILNEKNLNNTSKSNFNLVIKNIKSNIDYFTSIGNDNDIINEIFLPYLFEELSKFEIKTKAHSKEINGNIQDIINVIGILEIIDGIYEFFEKKDFQSVLINKNLKNEYVNKNNNSTEIDESEDKDEDDEEDYYEDIDENDNDSSSDKKTLDINYLLDDIAYSTEENIQEIVKKIKKIHSNLKIDSYTYEYKNFRLFSKPFNFKDCNSLKNELNSFSILLKNKHYSYFEIPETSLNDLCTNKTNLLMNYLTINPIPNFNPKTSDIHTVTNILNFYNSNTNERIELKEVIHYFEMSKNHIPIYSYLKMYSEIFYSSEIMSDSTKKEYLKRINEAYVISNDGEIYRNYDRKLRINQMHRYIHTLLRTSNDYAFNTFRNNIFTRDNSDIQIDYDSYEITYFTNDKNKLLDNSSKSKSKNLEFQNGFNLLKSREKITFEDEYLRVKINGKDNQDEIRIDFLYDDPDYNNYNIKNRNNFYWIYRREIFKNIKNYYSLSTLYLLMILIEMTLFYSYFLYRYYVVTPKLEGNDYKTYGKKIRKYINELRFGNLEGELSPLQNLDQSIVESEKSVHLETSIKDNTTCKDNYEDYYDKSCCECFIWNIKMGIFSSRFDINRLYAPRFKLSISQFTYFIIFILIIILVFNYSEYDASDEIDFDLILKSWIVSISLANLINVLLAQVFRSPKDIKELLSNNPPKSDEELAECMSLNLSNITIVHICQMVLIVIVYIIFSYFLLGFTITFKKHEAQILAIITIGILIDIFIFEIIWSFIIAVFVHGKRGDKPNLILQGMIEFTKLRSNS